ncbi:MAG: DEAD/DEAH box helicase family protein [Alphaproteobacteria bacterium]|nr:DEAD/DEAH box helicase family protein [Alphaproteobacteria bacterium]
MARTSSEQNFSFEFFSHLKNFYYNNRPSIRKHYKELTKRILDYNDPEKGDAFLRKPQFEALEMYIFLKEFANNKKVHEIFRDWHEGKNGFEKEKLVITEDESGQQSFMKTLVFSNEDEYKRAFDYLAKSSRQYANYIFALTMGTGKTILMATCIFYEFILANKFRNDARYCQNALVFAPDKTVLQSLREIKDFDISKVLPPEYANFISSAVKFHYLSDTDTSLSVQPESLFNIIISNTQKIIIKKQHKEKSKLELFYTQPSTRALQEEKPEKKKDSTFDAIDELMGNSDVPQDEKELIPNARFQRIAQLPQLGIYVDEAHHSIGKELASSQTNNKEASSLRTTINELASRLDACGSRVVACYNYTGTPYIGRSIMPEVVYAYSLADAIKNKYLKQTDPIAYSNIKSEDFIRNVIKNFWEQEGEKRVEDMLPKLAFFAATIKELEEELQPKIEKVLDELGISTDKILINVGDPKLTTNDQLREFNSLDTPESNKQFILLVGKGREGWNCRSLFGVALFRKPKSTIFVLQATMRCLRSIGPNQETGHIYLSEENLNILDDELQRNFNVTLADIKKKKELPSYTVRMVPPPVKITLNRVKRVYSIKKKKECPEGVDFGLDSLDYNNYKVIKTDRISLLTTMAKVTDITETTSRRQFSAYMLVAEIARYFNNSDVSCFIIKKILEASKEGIAKIVDTVNLYNDILYDVIIPIIYKNLYEITSTDNSEPEEIELVKIKDTIDKTVFIRKCSEDLVTSMQDAYLRDVVEKSFNLDTYCFDSTPEIDFFRKSIFDDNVEKIYFTGMLTHGESDFYINYIDPESHTVRNYYPDFLIKTKDNKWLIIEIKGDNRIDDPVVLAKAEYARRLASDSMFEYYMVKGTDAKDLGFAALDYKSTQGSLY